jgi:hypothetical protein
MLSLTLLALVYIHLQMQIVDLAYQGKAKEKTIRKLVETNGNITYTILSLKSAHNLGKRLLQDDSNMQFVHPDDVIQVSTSSDIFQVSLTESSAIKEKKNLLLSLLSFGTQAQAQPLD